MTQEKYFNIIKQMYISREMKFNDVLLELTIPELNELCIDVLADLMDNDLYNYSDTNYYSNMCIFIKSKFTDDKFTDDK